MLAACIWHHVRWYSKVAELNISQQFFLSYIFWGDLDHNLPFKSSQELAARNQNIDPYRLQADIDDSKPQPSMSTANIKPWCLNLLHSWTQARKNKTMEI